MKKKMSNKISLRDNLVFSYSVHVWLSSISFERKVISSENALRPLAPAWADIAQLKSKKQIDVQLDANQRLSYAADRADRDRRSLR